MFNFSPEKLDFVWRRTWFLLLPIEGRLISVTMANLCCTLRSHLVGSCVVNIKKRYYHLISWFLFVLIKLTFLTAVSENWAWLINYPACEVAMSLRKQSPCTLCGTYSYTVIVTAGLLLPSNKTHVRHFMGFSMIWAIIETILLF